MPALGPGLLNYKPTTTAKTVANVPGGGPPSAKDIDYKAGGNVVAAQFGHTPDNVLRNLARFYQNHRVKGINTGGNPEVYASLQAYANSGAVAGSQQAALKKFLTTGDTSGLHPDVGLRALDYALREQGRVQQTKGGGLLDTIGKALSVAGPVASFIPGGQVFGGLASLAGGAISGNPLQAAGGALGALGGVQGLWGLNGPPAALGNAQTALGAAGVARNLFGSSGSQPAAGSFGSPSSSATGPTRAPYGDNAQVGTPTQGGSAPWEWAGLGGLLGGLAGGGAGTGGGGSGGGGSGGVPGGGSDSGGSGGGSGGSGQLPDIPTAAQDMDIFREGGLFGGRYTARDYLRPIAPPRYFDVTTNPFLSGIF